MSEDTRGDGAGGGLLLPGGRIRFRIPSDGAQPPPPPPVSMPEGYEYIKEVGRGGMGVVYQARERELDRVVALKMILPDDPSGGEALTRFQTEAEAIARLLHPNIVRIYKIGRHDGLPFIAMEYVGGETLATELVKKPMTPREAAGLVGKLARAMQHSHEQGIVHRDLKPANVLFDREGVPKIADFGLAKKLDIDSSQTRAGSIIGTPSYMAPEQAAGGEDVGPKADVYAMGAILYECLVAHPPFLATTVLDTLLQVRDQDAVSPRYLNPAVPTDLDTICLRCLAKDPAKRYAGAGDLADDLDRFTRGEPIHARPVGPAERLGKWAKREPWIAGVVILAPLVVITGLSAGIAILLWQKASGEKRQEVENRERAELDSERNLIHRRFASSFITMHQGKREVARAAARAALAEVADFCERHPEDEAGLAFLGNANASYALMLDTPISSQKVGDNFSPTMWLVFNRPNEKARRALEDQLVYFDRAIAAFQRLNDRFPDPEAGSESSRLDPTPHLNILCGHLLGMLSRFTEAVERYDLGIPLQKDRAEKTRLVLLRIGILKAAEGEQAKMPWSHPLTADHAKAMRLGAYLAEANGVSPAGVYNVACAYALASAEPGISPEEKERRGARAVGYLRRITGEGYFRDPNKRRELKEDADLAPIRDRADFAEVRRSTEDK